ncbi:hypothetical protein [Deinococcus sp. UYEF24]
MSKFTTLTIVAALALDTPSLAASSDFLGTWTNTDANTRGITHIVVPVP